MRKWVLNIKQWSATINKEAKWVKNFKDIAEVVKWLSIVGSAVLTWFHVQLTKDNNKMAQHIQKDSVIVEKYRSAPKSCDVDTMEHKGKEKLTATK
jgi:hypothetical protein